jgi:hypothetical protein
MKKRKIKLDKNSEDWGKKNKWFGSDQEKTYYAFDIHNLLMKNGIDPATKSYYKIIDGFISHYDENKIMRLTRGQMAIAKKLGVPLKRIMGKTYVERNINK